MQDRKNYFVLPGLYSLNRLNLKLMQLYKTNSHYFYPNTYLIYVQGCFPNCIWNGDSMLFSSFQPLVPEMMDILQMYNRYNLQPILNFSNSELEKEDCNNVYGNIILKTSLAINFNTACIVNSKCLYEYLLFNYPKIMKIYLGKNNLIPNNCFNSLFYFLNPSHNENEEFLKSIKNKQNTFITLNPICISCNTSVKCTQKENYAQLNFDPDISKFKTCPYLLNHQYSLSKDKKISRDSILNYHNQLGFFHFSLEEYPNFKDNLEEYLFYFIKPEFYNIAKDFLSEAKNG